MPPHDPGKPRPARIALDYFTQADGLRWWKVALAVAATTVALAWWLSGFLHSDGGRTRYSRGPVASVHAMWDEKCDACHTSFQPIQGDAWVTALGGDPLGGDLKCQQCHAGPPHHTRDGETANCATCHREHRGRDASLVQLADAACVRCHKDLLGHGRKSRLGFELPRCQNTVTRFDVSHHPQFFIYSPETKRREPIDAKIDDPSQLKFNHKLHMTAGMVLDPNGKPFRYGKIVIPHERARYMSEAPSPPGLESPVQMTCASCHRLDAGDFAVAVDQLAGLPRAALLPPRAAGTTMQPIIYENQCKACHPLTFEPRGEVLHRLQPPELHDFLENYYTRRFLEGKPELLELPIRSRIIPGKPPDDATTAVRQRIVEKVAAAEKVLYQDKKTCGECHYYERDADKVVPKQIVPPKVPTVWLPHAQFSHATHRAVECTSCHPRADADAEGASTRAADILLPGIEVCVRCHAPASRNGGGALFHCTECHRYHNGDAPLHGVGAELRQPRQRRSLDDLLGTPRP